MSTPLPTLSLPADVIFTDAKGTIIDDDGDDIAPPPPDEDHQGVDPADGMYMGLRNPVLHGAERQITPHRNTTLLNFLFCLQLPGMIIFLTTTIFSLWRIWIMTMMVWRVTQMVGWVLPKIIHLDPVTMMQAWMETRT